MTCLRPSIMARGSSSKGSGKQRSSAHAKPSPSAHKSSPKAGKPAQKGRKVRDVRKGRDPSTRAELDGQDDALRAQLSKQVWQPERSSRVWPSASSHARRSLPHRASRRTSRSRSKQSQHRIKAPSPAHSSSSRRSDELADIRVDTFRQEIRRKERRPARALEVCRDAQAKVARRDFCLLLALERRRRGHPRCRRMLLRVPETDARRRGRVKLEALVRRHAAPQLAAHFFVPARPPHSLCARHGAHVEVARTAREQRPALAWVLAVRALGQGGSRRSANLWHRWQRRGLRALERVLPVRMQLGLCCRLGFGRRATRHGVARQSQVDCNVVVVRL